MAARRNPLNILGAALLLSMAGAAGADAPWPKHAAATGPDLLPADEAFALDSAQRRGDAIEVRWTIADGYYLYRKRFVFSTVDGTAPAWSTAQFPAADTVDDGHEVPTEIYRGRLTAVLPLGPKAAAPRRLRVRYQGCAEAGVCYPPQTRIVDVAAR